MKLLKSTLLVLTILAIQPVSARNVTARRGGNVLPAPAPTASNAPDLPSAPDTPVVPPLPPRNLPTRSSFQYYLQQVRVMKPSDVINNQGVFTQEFQNMVKSSGLESSAMQALLEAGRNLHLPLSGNNNQDLAAVEYAGEGINRFIAKEEASNTKVPQDITAAFYNSRTNLFNQDYLDRYIASNASLTTVSQKDAERMIISELMPKITDAWKRKNIPMSVSQVDAARGQIIRTIEKEFKKWSAPQASMQQKEWYNGWTQLLSTQYLDKFVGDALRLRKPQRQYENELEKLEKQVKSQWEEEGITRQTKEALAVLLNKQLEETAQAIQQKRTVKKEILNELEGRAQKIINLKAPKLQVITTETSEVKMSPASYAADLSNKFDGKIKQYFVAENDNSRFVNRDRKFSDLVTEITNDILTQYPQISLDNLIDTAELTVTFNQKLVENSLDLKKYIASIIAPNFKNKAISGSNLGSSKAIPAINNPKNYAQTLISEYYSLLTDYFPQGKSAGKFYFKKDEYLTGVIIQIMNEIKKEYPKIILRDLQDCVMVVVEGNARKPLENVSEMKDIINNIVTTNYK